MNGHQYAVLQFHKKFGLTIESKPKIPCDKDIECRKNLIEEEAREFVEASDKRDIVGIADALADLLYVVYGAAITYGIDIEPVFREVHRSNMTKLWTQEEVDNADPVNCLNFIRQDNGRYLVKRAEDGKVIKSPSYSEADVQGAIEGISL